MKIDVRDSAEFKRLLEALVDERQLRRHPFRGSAHLTPVFCPSHIAGFA